MPAPWLEERVVGRLHEMFGDSLCVRRAVKAAVPDCEALVKQRDRLQAELDRATAGRQRVLALVAKGAVEGDAEVGHLVDYPRVHHRLPPSDSEMARCTLIGNGLSDTRALALSAMS